MNVRVRFAPSPTGYLHVGGARTALFNWLYARHEGGKFLLRIEDTDKARSTDEHTQVILDGLTWLGLDWDEELVFQGARVKRHQEIADRLLAEGKAYMDEGAIRFRVPPGEIAWEDAVHGHISFQGADIKDFIILRSDRTPIYNLAVVVDDLDMRITHVLRGDDHISNTPKQIALYQTLAEMIRLFSFAGIQQKAAIFDMTKLEWMNGQYLSMTPAEDLYPLVAPQLEKLGVNGNREAVLKAIAAVKTRSRTTLDVARQVAARLDAKHLVFDEKAKKEIAKDPAAYKASLEASLPVLKAADWTPEALERTLRALAEQQGVAAGKIFQPIRIALTGGTVSEPVNELLYVVGKEAALARLKAAITAPR